MKVHKITEIGFAVQPEIGDVFEINEVKVKCVESTKGQEGCPKCCMSEEGLRGPNCTGLMCHELLRLDCKFVYFEEVKGFRKGCCHGGR